MRLPDFLIIGAQKAGTTWLAGQLGQHPSVFMAPDEIHYFDKASNFSRGIEWYAAHFEDALPGVKVGEKTPDYLWANGDGAEGHLPDVHKNLHQALPDAKLIAVLRNPVERALSALVHLVRTRRIPPTQDINELLLGRKHKLITGHGVIRKGFYYRQLLAYTELYPRRQVLVLIYEEDIDRGGKGLQRACEFIGVRPIELTPEVSARKNETKRSRLRLLADFYFPPARPVSRWLDRVAPVWKPAPSERTIDELYQMFASENEKLFRWLGRPVPASWCRWEERGRAERSGEIFSSRHRP
jgi:hypothetical protein